MSDWSSYCCSSDLGADLERILAPGEAEVRRRLGNFVLAEDDQTLEGLVLAALAARGGSLSVAETFTGGGIAGRLTSVPGSADVFRRGAVSRASRELCAAPGLVTAAGAHSVSTHTPPPTARVSDKDGF